MDDGASQLERKQRVVYSLLRGAARVAGRVKLPLADLEALTQMAYLEEARERHGLKLAEVADLFGRSLRTVSELHRRFRSDFFAPEQQVALRRAIAALVNHKPATEARLREVFADVGAAELASAVDDLVRGGTLKRDGELLRRDPDAHDFTGPELRNAVDGLNRQMDVVAAAVWHRLVSRSDAPALARTYVFDATDEDALALIEAVSALVKERAIAADTAAKGAGRRMGLTFAAAPLEDE